MTKHTPVSCNLDKLVSVVDQLSSMSLLLYSIPAVPRVAYSGMCRQKKAIRKEEEKELRKREEENADGQWADNPRSVEDFERLLLTQGDTSIVWIRCLSALIIIDPCSAATCPGHLACGCGVTQATWPSISK